MILVYGVILYQYVMTPEDYDLWSRRDNNIYVSSDAAEDIVSHFEMEKGEVISSYEIKQRLGTDRNFSELHGVDMTDDLTTIFSLAKLGFISRVGIEGNEEIYSPIDCKIYTDNASTPKGEKIVVMTIVESE